MLLFADLDCCTTTPAYVAIYLFIFLSEFFKPRNYNVHVRLLAKQSKFVRVLQI